MNFEKILRDKGVCCVTGMPLNDSKFLNLVELDRYANWQYPMMGNMLTGQKGMAVAVLHDKAIDANGIITGTILHAIEYDEENSDVIYHLVAELEQIQTCRECGCHEFDACIHPIYGNCSWTDFDDNLCSHCKYHPGEATRYSVIYARNRKRAHEEYLASLKKK